MGDAEAGPSTLRPKLSTDVPRLDLTEPTPIVPRRHSAAGLLLKSALKQSGSNQGSPATVSIATDGLSRRRTTEETTSSSTDLLGHSTKSSSLSQHGFKRRVAFDTWTAAADSRTGGGTGIDFSFTLQSKSEGYERTRRTREFLVATDLNEYSMNALDWLLANLLEDGDEVVVLRVIEPASSSSALPEAISEEAKDEARAVMHSIMTKMADVVAISIIVELCVGKIQETIQRMISMYKPDSLVVGTRGRTETLWRTALMGSVSRYCLMSSPVPVIVVRPERKVRKSLEQRKSRSSYSNLINTPLRRYDTIEDSTPNSTVNSRPGSPDRGSGRNSSRNSVIDFAQRLMPPDLPSLRASSKKLRKFRTAPG